MVDIVERWVTPMVREHKVAAGETLAVMGDVRTAFNPEGRCAPHKMLPTAGGCGMEHIERDKPGRRAAM